MGFGWTETLLILGILLLLFGPSKLPELARSLGESFNVFKQEMNDVKSSVENTSKTLEKEAAGIEDKRKGNDRTSGDSHNTSEISE